MNVRARRGAWGVAAIVAAPFALSALGALAQARAAPTGAGDEAAVAMTVALATCDQAPFSYDDLRAKLALSLRPEGIRLAKPDESARLRAALFWSCESTFAAARIEIQSDEGAHVERVVDVADVAAKDRPAVLALAVAETARALAGMKKSGAADAGTTAGTPTPTSLSTPTSTSTSTPSPGPTPTPTPTPTSVPTPTALPAPTPTSESTSMPTPSATPESTAAASTSDSSDVLPPASGGGARTVSAAGELQRFTGAGPSLLGARLDLSLPAVRFGVAALGGTAHDTLGDASVLLLRAGVVWTPVSTRRGLFAFTFGPFLHLGRVAVRPSAQGSAASTDSAEVYLAGGLEATTTLALGFGFGLGVGIDGGVARGVTARADDRVLVTINGPFVSGLALLTWER